MAPNTCTHTHAQYSGQDKHTHKHGETQTRGENEISNSSKTASHRWEKHAKDYNIIHKNILFIFTYNTYTVWSPWKKQRIIQGVEKTAVLAIGRCVCRCICVSRPFAHHFCPWNEAQTASCQYLQRSVQ